MKAHISVSRTCVSGKMSYSTKSKAKSSAKHMSSRSGRELTVYQCPTCGYWHLAKTPKEIQRTNFYRKMVGAPERGEVIFVEESSDRSSGDNRVVSLQ